MTHNALETLWGSGDPERDRRRKNTAKSMISPSVDGVERPQEIYTPPIILEVIAEVWPEGIVCDPCYGPDSLVPAFVRYDGLTLGSGLLLPWPNFTYSNPPYKDLQEWIAKMTFEALWRGSEIIMLCPVRTHRKWFRAVMELCDAISFLDPLCFVGYEQAFPAPLCLIYFGKRVDAFKQACKRVSE